MAYSQGIDGDKMTPECHPETFQRAQAAGEIAFGADLSGNHARTAQEFVWMVRYRMAPLEALRSVTSAAAELMGWQNRVGAIDPDKLADVVA